MMQSLVDAVRQTPAVQVWGKVTNIVGVLVQGYCPNVSVGSLCEILPEGGQDPVPAEVVGFRDAMALFMPLGELRGLAPGNLIRVLDSSATLPVGQAMLGRVLDAMGNPIDGKGELALEHSRSIYAQPPGPMERAQISSPLDLGVSSINGLLTCGLGQRMAIMAGSGVGKSTLMGMIARDSKASVNVIAL
ncbi:MAG: flagellum-specific ATP synthase FliI, partial [Desulfohalobium sp.]